MQALIVSLQSHSPSKFRIVKNHDGYPGKAHEWLCIWNFCKRLEDRLDLKCNIYMN